MLDVSDRDVIEPAVRLCRNEAFAEGNQDNDVSCYPEFSLLDAKDKRPVVMQGVPGPHFHARRSAESRDRRSGK